MFRSTNIQRKEKINSWVCKNQESLSSRCQTCRQSWGEGADPSGFLLEYTDYDFPLFPPIYLWSSLFRTFPLASFAMYSFVHPPFYSANICWAFTMHWVVDTWMERQPRWLWVVYNRARLPIQRPHLLAVMRPIRCKSCWHPTAGEVTLVTGEQTPMTSSSEVQVPFLWETQECSSSLLSVFLQSLWG